MRSRLSLVLFGLWSFLGIAGALQAQTQSVTIDYTGSLYGYYRMEPDEAKSLPPVDRFLKARARQQDKLLLGMGDNFGPEFGAALQMENPNTTCELAPIVDTSKYHETRPQSLYKDDDRVAPEAHCDNVLNFMMHAGYRAIVPGREDFMYTSRWLRVSARLLQRASSDPNQIRNRDHALHLLGANLRIESKGQPGKNCPLLFAAAPLAPGATPCYSAGQPETLEFLERLDRLEMGHGHNAASKALESDVDRSANSKGGGKADLISLVRDQVNIFLSSWGSRGPAASLKKRLTPIPENADARARNITALLGQDVTALQEETLEKVCQSAPTDQDEKDMCTYRDELVIRLNRLMAVLQGQAFDGKASLHACPSSSDSPEDTTDDKFVLSDCAREAAIHGLLRTIDTEQVDVGYTISGVHGGPRVLIIGVAGPQLKNAISQTNLDLCPAARSKDGSAPTDFDTCNRLDTDNQSTTEIVPKLQVTITDPVAVAAAIVRAVELKGAPLDAVVVLAQMTHTEAEVFSARLKRQLDSVNAAQAVDLVISEAEEAYSTPSVTLNYNLEAGQPASHPAPVFTPLKSYSSIGTSFPGTVYEATVNSLPKMSYSISNAIETSSELPAAEPKVTIASCFTNLVDQLKASPSLLTATFVSGCVEGNPSPPPPAATSRAAAQRDKADAARDELLLFEMLQKAVTPHADVVLLQSRDLQLDPIDPAYTGYQEVCAGEDSPKSKQLCRLRIALDRIFWKGDYFEFVAVKGSDLSSMIDLSNQKMDNRSELVDRDIAGEWLVTYGIVQSSLTNVTQVNRNDEPLWIPVDSSCKGPSAAHVYCVGGTPLVDDQYYWLLTSDHLAQDAMVYGTLRKLPKEEHATSRRFLTAPLARYLLKSLDDSTTRTDVMNVASDHCNGEVECEVATRNAYLQQQPLWQMDFLKVVANFTSRSPVGGNQFVGSYFQGVSDSRASAPSQQELDLEFANRITGDLLGTLGRKKRPTRFSEGVQTSFGYDRSVVGNLSPATKPINSSYSLNNLTVGGFVQMRLGGKHDPGMPPSMRSLPRWLLVLTPYQYQIQVNHQYLFFPFAGSSPVPGELTATLPRNTSWTDRVGLRHEFGPGSKHALFTTGSYIEGGGEYFIQNNVLSSITLANGATQKTCMVNATITLQACFSQPPQFVITSNTRLAQPAMTKDLHSPGVYWNFHLQNRLFGKGQKQVNLVTDTQGDFYFGRTASAELPTQTEYAIPISVSLVFPAFGNFSFAPTYSGFFYKPQLSSQSLQVNSFSITARWYLARDNRVPVVRQSKLPGPQSSDQTKTAKAH